MLKDALRKAFDCETWHFSVHHMCAGLCSATLLDRQMKTAAA
jgi:hypothetical protein